MKRISKAKWLMLHAHLASVQSTCARLHVGGVLVRGSHVLCQGYNGAPRGVPHCQCVANGPPEAHCPVSVHAEQNIVNTAARHGHATEGAEVYLTHAPCIRCAGSLINAGIIRVSYAAPYGPSDGLVLLRNAGVKHRHLHDG